MNLPGNWLRDNSDMDPTKSPTPNQPQPTEAEIVVVTAIWQQMELKADEPAAIAALRQHVAQETATLRQQLENQASIIRDSCTPANVREERMLRELATLREQLAAAEGHLERLRDAVFRASP